LPTASPAASGLLSSVHPAHSAPARTRLTRWTGFLAQARTPNHLAASGQTLDRRIQSSIAARDVGKLTQFAPGTQSFTHPVPDLENFPSRIAAIIIGWHLLTSFIVLERHYKSLFGSTDRSKPDDCSKVIYNGVLRQ
jgi:hypothetical protein